MVSVTDRNLPQINMTEPQPPTATFSPSNPACWQLGGDWTLAHAGAIQALLETAPAQVTSLDARALAGLDSSGALQLIHFAAQRGWPREQFQCSERHHALIDAVAQAGQAPAALPRRSSGLADALARLGQAIYRKGQEATALASFFGEVLVGLARLAVLPQRLRLTATIHHMEQVGLDAVPLVAVLCAMVGAVIAFLGATVLAEFGAVIFVVELVSIAFLREFAVLLTAIVLAGRTASAFTAQIGAMVNREEIDAIHTLGLDPMELLILPRVLAMLVMLPLLTFIGMLAGLLGGMAVGTLALDIPAAAWMARMHEQMQLRHVLVGLSKAPLFALVIALIGCLEGLKVSGTAQSLGERTTASVVQTISLVIVLDAFAAIWFMQMGW